jgi:hypothetical protein
MKCWEKLISPCIVPFNDALFSFTSHTALICKRSLLNWHRNTVLVTSFRAETRNILRCSRNYQHYAMICSIPLFYILAPTCFGSSLPSSGSFLDPSELPEIQIEWVVYHHIMHGTNITLYSDVSVSADICKQGAGIKHGSAQCQNWRASHHLRITLNVILTTTFQLHWLHVYI